MEAMEFLHSHLYDTCFEIHSARLQSVMDVATALQKSQRLTLTAIGRNLKGDSDLKHKIKKVDRLESNYHLHNELEQNGSRNPALLRAG